MTTIRDVAARAGVSATTVSHVLNETRRVEPETIDRVQRAIAELGYRPNSVARSMRHGRTYTVGIIIPDVSNPFFADLARALEDAAFAGGYSAIFCNSDGDGHKEARYLDVLLSKRVDGLVLVSAGQSSDRLQHIVEAGPPMVVVDRELEDLPVSQVMVDNRLGGYLAGQYLVSLGHRRIGVIAGPVALRPSARRLEGIREALREARVPLPPELISRGEFNNAGGRHAMQALLDLDSPPTAVFAENDLMALGALAVAHDAGLRIPDDLSVMGFDDIGIANLVTPALTTIAQPVQLVAQSAMRLLFDHLRDPATTPERVALPVTVVVRGSCSAPAQVALMGSPAAGGITP